MRHVTNACLVSQTVWMSFIRNFVTLWLLKECDKQLLKVKILCIKLKNCETELSLLGFCQMNSVVVEGYRHTLLTFRLGAQHSSFIMLSSADSLKPMTGEWLSNYGFEAVSSEQWAVSQRAGSWGNFESLMCLCKHVFGWLKAGEKLSINLIQIIFFIFTDIYN